MSVRFNVVLESPVRVSLLGVPCLARFASAGWRQQKWPSRVGRDFLGAAGKTQQRKDFRGRNAWSVPCLFGVVKGCSAARPTNQECNIRVFVGENVLYVVFPQSMLVSLIR